ncbi:hypothetical protein HMPREF1487_09463 [Pseudomonas sp. HPB0071]|uniref:Uncharacterized protein n=1 Tax=Pseudomonas luteola TaxID=47886 RepID=A0A2X2DW85_PSELU|nr:MULTISPECIES: hypothetical protein [Pseudomonas]ENA26984.1 hypothetical protein HMPREF1487_09463 [Pseudomonas sp. HPB0071]MBA1250188.1 hypothetical protein [Pseudomonas zeshuii]MBH3440939.1 hypothetical protein [Pseudomonas luteola]SPY99959.1 Uncharacterised protein [Pseudomonas luteola]
MIRSVLSKKAGLIVVVTASFCLHLTSALAATTESAAGDCEIDTIMKSNRVAMDKLAVGVLDAQVTKQIGTSIDAAPNVKSGACLPILDSMDSLIRMKIPSVGTITGGILSKIRDMACNAANDFLASVARQAQVNISDPLGVASIGVGVSTGGASGVQTETYDFGQVVEDATERAVKDKVSGYSNDARRTMNNLPIGNQNRLPTINDTVDDEVRKALGGL